VRTGYYGCGGYIAKGTAVCERSIVQKEVIEKFILEEIGRSISDFLSGDDGREAVRKVLLDELGPQADNGEHKELLTAKADLERKIYNIIDNLTPSTRDYAEKRVAQLKAELDGIERKLTRLEDETAKEVDLDALVPVVLDYMKNFERVAAEGTVEEKRAFLRAFTRKIELDPATGTGRLEIFSLPRQGLPVQEKKDSQSGHPSSLMLVAGARVGIEPRLEDERHTRFVWGREGVRDLNK
jgi:polyhydroxyalkanoate synthesis regulator phasin